MHEILFRGKLELGLLHLVLWLQLNLRRLCLKLSLIPLPLWISAIILPLLLLPTRHVETVQLLFQAINGQHRVHRVRHLAELVRWRSGTLGIKLILGVHLKGGVGRGIGALVICLCWLLKDSCPVCFLVLFGSHIK